MAIPASALVWDEPMDPSDLVDYVVDCAPFLDDGEVIASFTLANYSEANLLGLQIGTGSYAPQIVTGTKIRMWFSIDTTYQANAAFDVGVNLPVFLNITTTSIPARKRQRTLVVKVVQR